MLALLCLTTLIPMRAAFLAPSPIPTLPQPRPRDALCSPLSAGGEPEEVQLVVDVKGEIKNIAKEQWDGLLDDSDSPFLEWDWINCVEQSGCAEESKGWRPLHVVVTEEGDPSGSIVAAAPLYLKSHSMGEFIFDNQWAEAAYAAGINYYPKLLCAVPFTPASGARVLVKQSLSPERQHQVRRVVGAFLTQLAQNSGISSVHVNFCRDEEVKALTEAKYLHRKGLQYHWMNQQRSQSNGGESPLQAYENFDGYLADFQSKRRIKIKRERRSVYEDAGVDLVVYRGEDIPDEMFKTMFKIYLTTIDKMMWGRQYLNETFFDMLRTSFKRNLCFIVAKRDDKVIAGTFNVVKAGTFYGRYWGAFDFVKNLHFETCYYKAIEYCIDEGLQVMEPGAGGGDFKFLRGFDPVVVNSMHYCCDRGFQSAVDRFVKAEGREIVEAKDYLKDRSKLSARQASAELGKD
ncbi:unnamed protein product [Chrysoparadoxa australica]